jgi:hypothetical protein
MKMTNEKWDKCTAANEAVWRKRRCSPAETAVQFCKFASRSCLSEPPPAPSRWDVSSKRRTARRDTEVEKWEKNKNINRLKGHKKIKWQKQIWNNW